MKKVGLAIAAIMGIGSWSAEAQRPDKVSHLEREMARAEVEADAYWSEANDRGAGNMGSMWNEVDASEHFCGALAYLLDREQFATKIETVAPHQFKRGTVEAEMLRVYSNSRTNYVVNAKRALSFSDHERTVLWNLECVGSFGIPAEAAIAQSSTGARFRVDGTTLIVLGDIEPGFSEALSRQIATNTAIETVSLGSAGGSLSDALSAGYMIRAMRLNTTLYSNCYSACTLVFMAGVNRTIWSPYPSLGFHQASRNGEAISPGSSAYRGVGDYAAAMGVNPKYVLAAMFSAKSDDVFLASIDDLCLNRITTWVQRRC